jgi:beta-N-acetylhexosaminidase
LVVIATCDPYDFLEEVNEIKNYITIYEPTVPAFTSAADIIFGITRPLGHLPVGSPRTPYNIRRFEGSEEEIAHIWKLWDEIFPSWRVEKARLGKILCSSFGKALHFYHDHGFCLAYSNEKGGSGKISIVGVLESHRGKGIGTAIVTQVRKELQLNAATTGFKGPQSLGIGSGFPRMWPGVPLTISEKDKNFLLHRGMHPSE